MVGEMNELQVKPISWLPQGTDPLYIFGPCSAENPEQVLSTARSIAKKYPNALFRAGVWKPRTRPNTFEGAGEVALGWLKEVKEETGLRTATEVANATHVEACLKEGVDVLWIGARTVVNPFSVQAIADALRGTDIPVMVKNPMVPDLQLWIGALERVNGAGIEQLAAIHRGFHFHNSGPYRNKPLWEIPIELMGRFPQLPVICDASHISGTPALIPKVAQKAMDLNMNGLMIESHIDPTSALSDARQQVTPEELSTIIESIVVRVPTADNEEFLNKMEILREEIDQIDLEILRQYADRMGLAKEIGKYKKENNVTIFQRERWEYVLRRSLEEGLPQGLSETFLKGIYTQVHDESIRNQTRVMNDE